MEGLRYSPEEIRVYNNALLLGIISNVNGKWEYATACHDKESLPMLRAIAQRVSDLNKAYEKAGL